MIEKAEQTRVRVFGESFTLLSDEQIEFVEKAAQRVDELMSQFAHGVRIPDAKRLAILTAIQLAHDLQKQEAQYANTELQIEELLQCVTEQLSL